MSRIHHRDIPLGQLVERSDLVLVVKAANPAQRQIKITIGRDPSGRQAPAFVRTLSRCDVLRALSRAGADLVGTTIEIDGAHWQKSLSLHKGHSLQGIRRSPIYERYSPPGPPTEREPAGAPFIVFLRRSARDGAAGLAFTVDGATERIGNLAAIEELLRGRQQDAR